MKKKLILIISIFFISINFVYAKEKVTFSKCVDGDTIKIMLDGEERTVRMLAIDTPESVHPTKGIEYYGKEASEFTCNQVTNAKKIELEYDDNSDKTDKYERLLAWVFVDNHLLQQQLIEGGYAKVAYLYDDYKYTNLLEEKQQLASAKSLGIWDETAKEVYNKENNIQKSTTDNQSIDDDAYEEDNETTTSTNNDGNLETSLENLTTKEIIIIAILIIIIVFVGDKTIKNKAKKQLKKYLK